MREEGVMNTQEVPVATKPISVSSAAQTAAAQRYKVVLTTDGSFSPTTMDAVVTLFVDVAWKA